MQVREFTRGAGQACPSEPAPMNDAETDFITKMILDEVMELMATRYPPAEAKAKMIEMIQKSKDIPKEDFSAQPTAELQELHEAAAQCDALVDVYYYSQNAACKKGMNMSAVFDVVHGANMAKRDPRTGEFIKRADGKIIKPEGWKAPDVEGEIVRQAREGSWA
ncbi:hypothetical protein TeGR_g14269 [Tetraparma gracilis]|uniref:Uncharacterized protein n=2 Tax=Tetraparma gracilis TaxID=2962635 RepID=A0ABQ6N447_9STRA|nr:hypothetical protein TeGR_g14269 [Tetraparma gracilis]